MRHVFQSGTTTRPHYSRKGRDSGSSLYLVQGADDQTARRRRAVPTLHLPEVRVPARHEVGEEIAEDCSCVPASTDEEDQVAWSIAPAPLGATLPGFSSWKPSGIPAAAVCDRGALVSSSFPSRKSLGGSPLLRRSPLTPCHPFKVSGDGSLVDPSPCALAGRSRRSLQLNKDSQPFFSPRLTTTLDLSPPLFPLSNGSDLLAIPPYGSKTAR